MNEADQALGVLPNIYYRFFRFGWRGEEASIGWYYQESGNPPVGPFITKDKAAKVWNSRRLQALRNET
jgi:hypothetical protein